MKELSIQLKEDEDILRRLKAREPKTEKNTFFAYKEYFLGYLIKYYHCSEEEAEEVYLESFTFFCLNIREGKLSLPLKAQLTTYLCGIGWRKLLKKYPKYGKAENRPPPPPSTVGLEEVDWDSLDVGEEIQDPLEWADKARFVKKLLAQLDQRCQEVLKLKFWETAPFKIIQQKLGFPSPEAARKKSFDCLKKLRELVAAHPEFKTII